MLKIEAAKIAGWETAIRGMRNPMNSWEKSDSKYCSEYDHPPIEGSCQYCPYDNMCNKSEKAMQQMYLVGYNDLDLMGRLRNAGTDHRKFMRMITVTLDIVAPLYWWKEFDTYKVGTVVNSCSTMHKIQAKKFTLEDFSCEHLLNHAETYNGYVPIAILKSVIGALNEFRELYLKTKTKNKAYWWQLIQLLPSSYNQRRTVMLNYEVLTNIYHARKNHKLDEWITFCNWVETLPYAKELIIGEEK